MARAPVGAAMRQFERIFGGEGTVAGLTEAQLLDRFAASGDDAAFEAIVRQHGNAVMAVCRRLLVDPHEAEDAFQATFLVLARRAGSIGRSRPIGPWLVGVAYRIARKAQVASARRRRRELVAAGHRPESTAAPDPTTIDLGPVLWEELHRLPGKYRDPVILCWVEGHSHDEAADRLRWPVGTVKGRLHRAKETLQKRLSHRGITAPAVGLSAWFSSEASAAVVPPPVLGSTVTLAAAGAAGGGALLAGTVPAASILLARGALRTMFIAKLSMSAAAITLISGSLVGGVGVIASSTRDGTSYPDAQEDSIGVVPREPEQAVSPSASKTEDDVSANQGGSATKGGFQGDPFAEHFQRKLTEQQTGRMLEELQHQRVEAARKRLEAQKAYFEAGSINIDRYLDAARALLDASLAVSSTPDDLRQALQEYRSIVESIANREAMKLDVGKTSEADVSEARLALAEAEVLLAAGPGSEPGDPSTSSTKITRSTGMSNGEESSDRNESAYNPSPGESGSGSQSGRPGSDPASQRIIARLEQPIAMPFENDTPLTDVLDYIRQATADENLRLGIPIYVDEFGLQQAEQSLQSPVKITLEGIPLRTTLWLTLRQLQLAYTVIDGVLIISNPDDLLDMLTQNQIFTLPDLPKEPAIGAGSGFGMGMGGGMGGSAGGFGMGGVRIGTGTSGFGAIGGMGGGVDTTSRPQPNLDPFDQ